MKSGNLEQYSLFERKYVNKVEKRKKNVEIEKGAGLRWNLHQSSYILSDLCVTAIMMIMDQCILAR